MGKSGRNFLVRGIIKLLILDSIYESEKHGYEIIKNIGDKFYGIYEPSPGIVYPTLQLLVDEGLIEEKSSGGKKVYFITENGKRVRDQSIEIINSFLHKKMSPNERVKIVRMLEIIRRNVYNQMPFLTDEQVKDVYRVLEKANGDINNAVLNMKESKKD
ncbi:MAG: PadR family transcriptional regulator [Nitrososphaerota archaeon]|jgi:DNA-binding PadR family transcriptional regulator|nr:PadR family transcriptional regulator [Nitrososphaerota archaeon]MDG6936788.1 PadR family transcriptional regulator [Nitrososphaerota archaeon]MDG6943644.1 PadR family transcriptional regulator [Nitrososphaerota archaeon]